MKSEYGIHFGDLHPLKGFIDYVERVVDENGAISPEVRRRMNLLTAYNLATTITTTLIVLNGLEKLTQ